MARLRAMTLSGALATVVTVIGLGSTAASPAAADDSAGVTISPNGTLLASRQVTLTVQAACPVGSTSWLMGSITQSRGANIVVYETTGGPVECTGATQNLTVVYGPMSETTLRPGRARAAIGFEVYGPDGEYAYHATRTRIKLHPDIAAGP